MYMYMCMYLDMSSSYDEKLYLINLYVSPSLLNYGTKEQWKGVHQHLRPIDSELISNHSSPTIHTRE